MRIYVRLRVAAEMFAVPVEYVLEVAALGNLTPVPGSPAAILGVLNLRGQILPVLDLALLLGIPRTGTPRRLLVAESAGCQAGFAVDEVNWVGELGDLAQETESDLLMGATFAGGDLIGVVDVPRVFDSLVGTPA